MNREQLKNLKGNYHFKQVQEGEEVLNRTIPCSNISEFIVANFYNTGFDSVEGILEGLCGEHLEIIEVLDRFADHACEGLDRLAIELLSNTKHPELCCSIWECVVEQCMGYVGMMGKEVMLEDYHNYDDDFGGTFTLTITDDAGKVLFSTEQVYNS